MRSRLSMNKKGQFYLFVMIILLAFVTTFILVKPHPAEIDQSRDKYFENIDREAEYVINGALYNQANVSTELDIFLMHMQELGKTRRVTLTYFYLLVNKTNATFHNAMDSPIFLIDYNITMSKDQIVVIERPDLSKIAFQVLEGIPDLSNFIYKFYITEEDNQVLYLLFAKRGDQYDLHIRDNT